MIQIPKEDAIDSSSPIMMPENIYVDQMFENASIQDLSNDFDQIDLFGDEFDFDENDTFDIIFDQNHSVPVMQPVHTLMGSGAQNGGLRLRIDGKKMIDPTTNKEIRLTGFNWTLKYAYKNEGQIMKDTLEGSNVARIVGVFWKNTND